MGTRTWISRTSLVGLASLVACAGGGDASSDSSSSYTSVGATITSTSDAGTDPTDGATDGGESSSTDGGEKLDVAGDGTGDGTIPATGCAKVDILFIVDNSASMGQYQVRLTEEFPTFIDAMYGALPFSTDLHVGITTTTFAGPFECTENEVEMNCQSSATFETINGNYIKPTVQDLGINGAQGQLFTFDQKRYFETTTDQDPAALTTWFTGAMTMAGENGCTFEMPVAAAGWAFDGLNAATNAGFVRDEGSLLVLFFLTDEPDKTPDSKNDHVNRVLSAKSECGGENCVVVSGLIDPCVAVPTTNNKLWQFMKAFDDMNEPLYGDIIDTQEYGNLVGATLGQTIADACDLVPVP